MKAMREFFDAARKAAPCVALIDEVDSFGDRRRFIEHDRHYWTMVVNGFLESLDAAGRAGILLIGTTNDPDRIDPAILRSGRFERCFRIAPPSVSDLAAILRHHLGRDLAAADLNAAARRAVGGTGADCAAWVRRARSRARRANRELLTSDLIAEIDVLQALPSRADDHRAAVHEGGHAVVAHALGFELGTIAIHGAFGTGGMTDVRRRDMYPTDEELHELLVVHLAGRAAEILVLGRPSTGSEKDLAEATEISLRMHCRWGLKGSLAVRPKPMSSDDMSSVELDLRQASATATSILTERRTELDRLVELLTRRRALDDADLTSLLGSVGRHRPSNGPNAGAGSGNAPDRSGSPKSRRVERSGRFQEGADG
ncbi:AAA family ATPase [Methylobacterium sp. NMS14P]|uniref:AAA family ATPase n=1 Tax=Methylobacterium sp. NMS14P TaxID=2894310 RepID=UPI00235A0944|nr:AAA family ATPase [Methylobacterium sp. NMS14P]WCS24867.1 AAA family ATPase [Methylobacterium sp. NMS14P]